MLQAHATRIPGHARILLAVPSGGFERHADAIFSPSTLGAIEAEQWGIGTLEDIGDKISLLEGGAER